MPSLYEVKEREITDTPVILFECKIADGGVYRWSSHELTVDGQLYGGRVLKHDAFDLRFGTDRFTDANTRISLTLANTDSSLTAGDATGLWKGASLTAQFGFFDLANGMPTSDRRVLFRGVCTGVDEIGETSVRLSFSNRLGMQRVWLPNVRLQRRCPWVFPSTIEQQASATGNGAEGKYSPFYRCGYSAGVVGGVGNLMSGTSYGSCRYTSEDCAARGMLMEDSGGRATQRFGGIPLLPSPDERGATMGQEDLVPLVYGTAWVRGKIMASRADGNITQYEVALALGAIQQVKKLIVNGYEIPVDVGQGIGSSGLFRLVSRGEREGKCGGEFGGNGGPHGSIAFVVLTLPNSMQRGSAAPTVDALMDGMILSRYQESGEQLDQIFTRNPAWVLLDVLRRSGWHLDEIDVSSFARVAAVCDEPVSAETASGLTVYLPRYQFEMAIQSRTSAGDIIRSLRGGSSVFLRYNIEGRLELACEDSLAVQQPVKPAGSNSVTSIQGGWPSYEFGDGTHGLSGIARRANGEPGLRFFTRNTGDTPNRYNLDFADEFNLYQTDSASLVDVDDVERTGQEVTTAVGSTGISNYNQAVRILRRTLLKTVRGNYYAEFLTSVRGVSLRPGDLITLTYQKEGLDRRLFRILSITPAMNYSSVQVLAQFHDDAWYADDDRDMNSGQLQPGSRAAMPRPIGGTKLDETGRPQYEVTERPVSLSDGTNLCVLSADFRRPSSPAAAFSTLAMMSISPEVSQAGGSLTGARSFYYGITPVDGDGREGPLSSLSRATLAAGDTYGVTLTGIGLPMEAVAFRVYRGEDPTHLCQIGTVDGLSAIFADMGLAGSLILAPDANFHHASFYWREELHPPTMATDTGERMIGNQSVMWAVGSLVGQTVQIVGGSGWGQERRIVGNTATMITVDIPWEVVPSAESLFCIAESGWRQAGISYSSTVDFEVPNRSAMVVHVNGRSANAQGLETPPEASPITRWSIAGSSGEGGPDDGQPPEPSFGLATSGGGVVQVSGVGFATMTNTRTIDTGTLSIHYWNELAGTVSFHLTNSITAEETWVELDLAGPGSPGSYVQVGSEIVEVKTVENGGAKYVVTRGVLGSCPSAHVAGTPMFHLSVQTSILPFPHDFFGSVASGQYGQSIRLPDVRVVAAELFVTNSYGHSTSGQQAYGTYPDMGLRTLSGGQYSLEVPGYLAKQTNATPLLVIDASHAVRDVEARVTEAPGAGGVELQVKLSGLPYCLLSIASGSLVSNVVNGALLYPLPAQGILTLDVVSVPGAGTDQPGRDLTVRIRL